MFKFILALALVAIALAQHGGEEAHAEIKYLNSDVNHHGFDYSFETTNHIKAAAQGDEHGNIKGEFEWVDPHGEHVEVKYVADENGYQPTGNVVHEAIVKGIQYILSHPSHDEYHGH